MATQNATNYELSWHRPQATLTLRYSHRQFPNRSNSPSLARLRTCLSLWCGMGPWRLWLGDGRLADAWICWVLKLSEVFPYWRNHWFDLLGIEPFLSGNWCFGIISHGQMLSGHAVTDYVYSSWSSLLLFWYSVALEILNFDPRFEPSEILLLTRYLFLLELSIWHLETHCWVWSRPLDII
jgi:hypothetical protein